MAIKFSISCAFIFYIVFSFSFCLLQIFVIRGNYLIEKKKKEKKPTNCLSVFDHFVGLALKVLKKHQKTSGFLIFPGDIERD